MIDPTQRLEALERRIRGLEDQLAIYQLFATYGPAVDSLAGEAVGAMWRKEGVYDTSHHVFAGADEIGALVDTPMHREYVAQGCAHVMSLPHVVIDGDHAIATGHSRVYLRDGAHWRVERASANRWELARDKEGWKVVRRINRLLDGDEGARSLLGQAFDGMPPMIDRPETP